MFSSIIVQSQQLEKIKAELLILNRLINHLGDEFGVYDAIVSILDGIVEYLESQMQVSPTVTCDGIYPPGTK